MELLPWAESKQQLDKTIFQTENTAYRDWRKVAQAIQCLTLLIVAEVEKGAIVTPHTAAEVQALNPRVQVVKVAGTGHSIRRDNYTDTMTALRAFLRAI